MVESYLWRIRCSSVTLGTSEMNLQSDRHLFVFSFGEYVEKVDVIHCILRYLLEVVKRPEPGRDEIFWTNFFGVLEMVKMSENLEEEDWLIPPAETGPTSGQAEGDEIGKAGSYSRSG